MIKIPEWVRAVCILLLLAVAVPFALCLVQTYIDAADRATPVQEEGTR